MDFSRNERIAMAFYLKTICIIDENSTQISQDRIKVIKDYLNWSEIEDRVEAMDVDKACNIMCKMSSDKKCYLIVMALWIALADGNISKRENEYINNIGILCKIPPVSKNKTDEIISDIIESVKNPNPKEQKTTVYYQKQYQADYALNHDLWDGIIPECSAEMAGALLFCKHHSNDWHYNDKIIATLRRLVEVCEMDYTDAPEVQKILPSVKQILQEKEENDRKKAHKEKILKKVRYIVWLVVLVLIILQAIFWGWWTILSGIITLVIAVIINNLVFE